MRQAKLDGSIPDTEWVTIKKLIPKEMKELVKSLDDDPQRRSMRNVLSFQQQATQPYLPGCLACKVETLFKSVVP